MYKKLLVPLDGSELAEQVLPHVEALVKGSGIEEVIFLRVVEPPMRAFGSDYVITNEEEQKIMSSRLKDAQEYLGQLTNRLQSLGVTLSTKIEEGRADECIVEYATQQHADMIVMATHGRSGVSRWLMGSVADRVVRWSCIPVLIIRPEACIPKV